MLVMSSDELLFYTVPSIAAHYIDLIQSNSWQSADFPPILVGQTGWKNGNRIFSGMGEDAVWKGMQGGVNVNPNAISEESKTHRH